MNDSPPILFLHANGFPTGSYRQFLDALGQSATVHTMPVIDSPIGMDATARWPHMTECVIARLRELATPDRPLALAGHSMGGYLSLLAGERLAGLVASIVLIDAPLVFGWRSSVLEAAKLAGLAKRRGPAPIAARRRYHWASPDEAHAHLAAKKFAQRWAPGVLQDFIEHGLTPTAPESPEGSGVALLIAREVERDIYATLPARRTFAAYRSLRRAGIPIFMVAGTFSRETRMAGFAQNRRHFADRWRELPTGHLVPMEDPYNCAVTVLRCVRER